MSIKSHLPTWYQLPGRDRFALVASTVMIAGLIGLFSFYIYPGIIIQLQGKIGLPGLLLAMALTFGTLGWAIRKGGTWRSAAAIIAEHKQFIIVWAIASLLAIGLYQPGGRVQMDEISILSVSKAIHEEREAVMPSMIQPYGEVLKLTVPFIDKRPFFFATVVALFHDVLGYSYKNAFYANMVLAILTLGLVGLIGTRLGGSSKVGALTMLALASVPLFCEYATGGGIEIINLFSISLLFYTALRHMDNPTPVNCRIMIGAAILLAYSRYESLSFFAIPVLVIAIVFWRHKQLFLDWSTPLFIASLTPLACIHYQTFSFPAESFQFEDIHVTQAFSLGYIPSNLEHAMGFFLNTEHQITNSPLLFILGMVALALLVVTQRRRIAEGSDTNATILFWAIGAVIVAGFFLLMAYCWGALDDLVVSRLSLPLHLLWALAIAAVFRELKKRKWAIPMSLGLFAVTIYWSTMPISAKQYNQKNSPRVTVLNALDQFIESQPDKRICVLNGMTNFWATRDIFALAPIDVGSNPNFLANIIKSENYRKIYLIRELKKDDQGEFKPYKSDTYTYPIDLAPVSSVVYCDKAKLIIEEVLPSSAEKIAAFMATQPAQEATR